MKEGVGFGRRLQGSSVKQPRPECRSQTEKAGVGAKMGARGRRDSQKGQQGGEKAHLGLKELKTLGCRGAFLRHRSTRLGEKPPGTTEQGPGRREGAGPGRQAPPHGAGAAVEAGAAAEGERGRRRRAAPALWVRSRGDPKFIAEKGGEKKGKNTNNYRRE